MDLNEHQIKILKLVEHGASPKNIAKKLGISRSTIYRCMTKYNIKRKERSESSNKKPKNKNLYCENHGLVEHAFIKRPHDYCKETKCFRYEARCLKCSVDSASYRYYKKKRAAIELLGGKCARCGYNKCQSALEFHHKNPNTKSNHISKLLSRGTKWDKLKQELEKCELICANCHREEHYISNHNRYKTKKPEKTKYI